MAQKIRDIMKASPRALDAQTTLQDAAVAMLDDDIGDVIVSDGESVRGIVTDRDITIRAIAQGKDLRQTTLADICSTDLTTLSPEDPVDEAVRLLREHAIRRIPIVENGKAVGVVSRTDLAHDFIGESAHASDVSSSAKQGGEVCFAAGDLTAATAAYDATIARLLQAEGQTPQVIRDVSMTLSEIGDTRLRAVTAATAALALGRRVLESEQTPEALRAVSTWWYKLGEICLKAGEQAAASEAFDAAFALDQQLLEVEGQTTDTLLCITISYGEVADAYYAAGDVRTAVGFYEQALTYGQRALEIEETPEAAREVSLWWDKLGDVCLTAGELAKRCASEIRLPHGVAVEASASDLNAGRGGSDEVQAQSADRVASAPSDELAACRARVAALQQELDRLRSPSAGWDSADWNSRRGLSASLPRAASRLEPAGPRRMTEAPKTGVGSIGAPSGVARVLARPPSRFARTPLGSPADEEGDGSR